MQHEVAWSFGRTGAPASAYFTAARTAYSTKEAALDLSDMAAEAMEQEQDPNADFSPDPNDPMKVRCAAVRIVLFPGYMIRISHIQLCVG